MKTMLKIDGKRLWSSLMDMAAIGASAKGGVRRLALTQEDAAGRALFLQWCIEAGLTLSVDRVGNLFARRAGKLDSHNAVASGSHLDTQPEGGRFDGVYGVLAALEVVRTLNDHGIETEKPIEIVVWTNEEGARFTPAMLGSAAFTGAMPLDQALEARDAQGVTVADALAATSYAGARAVPGTAFDAYFEAHIEQGPVLEESGVPIGVVTGGQAIRWLDVRVCGQAAHAGTTPMPFRRDALFGTAEMAAALEAIAVDFAPQGLVTIGELLIRNSSRNTIAADLSFTVDLRHPDDARIAAMEEALRERFEAIAVRRGLSVEIGRHWVSPATPFDDACVATVARAVEALDYPHQRIVSGAGHDAIHLARYCPTAMIFIPCVDGLSHNEAEDALPEDVTRGADVLLHAMLERAGQVNAQRTGAVHAA
ncbi:Zn-dependent hydrolase [Caballeronia terrestris]|nr:Zn-dependent hydrolase [Caballeronia terrestris]